jgi:DNA repair photolyase
MASPPMVSVTTLDDLFQAQARAAHGGPKLWLKMILRAAQHGVPTGVMAAPMIPGLNEHELEKILEQAADAGARPRYVSLRLPHEPRRYSRSGSASTIQDARLMS